MFTFGFWSPFSMKWRALRDGQPEKMWIVHSRSQDASDKGACRLLRLWLKMAMQKLWNVEEDGKRTGRKREEEEDGAPH